MSQKRNIVDLIKVPTLILTGEFTPSLSRPNHCLSGFSHLLPFIVGSLITDFLLVIMIYYFFLHLSIL